ncbi:hypothetical protein EVAR_57016_1 [Eumeta japonica]|uniref:Uncharacterized protein n=1 Tax=Eumeta variegata TaxID=151549 RepID=A0A4C2A3T8_EUMVA|nr:hypothetical protein EVAR_57016_1 [Eumeta japonica]
MVRWVECSNGCVPGGAVPAGNTVQGETLYVGRAKYKGLLSLEAVKNQTSKPTQSKIQPFMPQIFDTCRESKPTGCFP